MTQIPDPDDRRANRIVFSERGSQLINAALTALREAEQALAMRLGYDHVRHLREALTADWGEVIGGTHPRGRKRSLGERSGRETTPPAQAGGYPPSPGEATAPGGSDDASDDRSTGS